MPSPWPETPWRAAVVDRAEWPLPEMVRQLTSRELAEVQSYHVQRQSRATLARVVARQLLAPHAVAGWCAAWPVDADHAVHAGEVTTEILSGPRRHRQRPRICRAGIPVEHCGVSFAHSGTFTLVMVGQQRVGADLEAIASKRPEFYRQMFSSAEQRWVVDAACDTDVAPEAWFTLLWCAKEAYLKATDEAVSVWSFGQWTMTPGLAPVSIASGWTAACGVSTTLRVEGPGTTESAHLHVRRQADLLAVGLQMPEGEDAPAEYRGTVQP